MKSSVITYLIGFFLLVTCFKGFSAPPPGKSIACLKIEGRIGNAGEGEGACTIELFCSNTLIDKANLKHSKKKFHFALKKNTVYTIRISQPGYMPRLICVDTRQAGGTGYTDLYSFSFETRLVKNCYSERLNKDVLELPIALIYFDQKKDAFVYAKEYTSKIKKEIAMK